MEVWGQAMPPSGNLGEAGCNTTGCIAGWACVAAGIQKIDPFQADYQAMAFLEINDEQHFQLFITDLPDTVYSAVTTPDALKVLKIFRDTGQIDWEKALRCGS